MNLSEARQPGVAQPVRSRTDQSRHGVDRAELFAAAPKQRKLAARGDHTDSRGALLPMAPRDLAGMTLPVAGVAVGRPVRHVTGPPAPGPSEIA